LDYRRFFAIAQTYIKSEELEFNTNILKRNPGYPDFLEAGYHHVISNMPPGGLQK
jgi:hypothetical protein